MPVMLQYCVLLCMSVMLPGVGACHAAGTSHTQYCVYGCDAAILCMHIMYVYIQYYVCIYVYVYIYIYITILCVCVCVCVCACVYISI